MDQTLFNHNPGHRVAPVAGRCCVVVALCLWLFGAGIAGAAVNAVTNGYWTNSAVWGGTLPGAGDAVVIPSGITIDLDEATDMLDALTLDGTLRFNGWLSALNATNVTISSSGTMTLPAPFGNAGPSNRVWVICTNFTLAAGGDIDVVARGYVNQFRSVGAGPGGGNVGQFGAGHGGHGLPVSSQPFRGRVYGDPDAPMAPGSAGGGSWTPQGGHGGGVVRIEAATVTVDGVINAGGGNGGSHGGVFGGGGSGGSVYISCSTFSGGEGSEILARGGGPSATCPGAGGRIAIHYDPAQQALLPVPQTLFSAHPGAGAQRADAMGTLYLSDGMWLSEPFSNLEGVWLHGDWATEWIVASDFSPLASFGFGQTNFTLTIAGDLMLDNVSLGVSAGSALHCENLSLLNGGSLSVFSAYVPTPVAALTTTAYGALVSVSNHLSVADGSWIYPISVWRPYSGMQNTNALGPLIRAGSLTVAADGGIDADRFGHPPPTGRSANTWGNGGGVGSGRGRGAYSGSRGASHGGRGVNAAAAWTYGSSNAPVFPGSGGGGGWSGTGATGGGAVRIQVAGRFELNGDIRANAAPRDHQGSGGAGGSIYIMTGRFRGVATASMQARGSVGLNDNSGSGGRIAVWTGVPAGTYNILQGFALPHRIVEYTGQPPTYLGAVNVAGGAGAESGTVVWLRVASGSVLILR